MELDGKAKTITISNGEQAPTISLRKMLGFVKKGMPVVALQAGRGNSINCLFDTDFPVSSPSLKSTDFETLKSVGAFTVLAEGFGGVNRGCRGVICGFFLPGTIPGTFYRRYSFLNVSSRQPRHR